AVDESENLRLEPVAVRQRRNGRRRRRALLDLWIGFGGHDALNRLVTRRYGRKKMRRRVSAPAGGPSPLARRRASSSRLGYGSSSRHTRPACVAYSSSSGPRLGNAAFTS